MPQRDHAKVMPSKGSQTQKGIYYTVLITESSEQKPEFRNACMLGEHIIKKNREEIGWL